MGEQPREIIAEALRDRFADEFRCDRSMTARARMAEQWANAVLAALEAEGIVLCREQVMWNRRYGRSVFVPVSLPESEK